MVKPPTFRSLRYAMHRLLGLKTTTVDGIRLVIDPARVDRSTAREIIKGKYELPERFLVGKVLRPGDRVLEIGCGVGLVSLLCNRIAGRENVLSYEANPRLRPLIEANFALNGVRPNVVFRAITTDGAAVRFFANPNVMSSSLFDRKDGSESIAIESDRFADARSGFGADVLVMDIEGAEVDILGQDDLVGLREMIVELHPHIVGADQTDGLIAALGQKGFTVRERLHKTVWFSRA
jgi:FkbM family methyltransferase